MLADTHATHNPCTPASPTRHVGSQVLENCGDLVSCCGCCCQWARGVSWWVPPSHCCECGFQAPSPQRLPHVHAPCCGCWGAVQGPYCPPEGRLDGLSSCPFLCHHELQVCWSEDGADGWCAGRRLAALHTVRPRSVLRSGKLIMW